MSTKPQITVRVTGKNIGTLMLQFGPVPMEVKMYTPLDSDAGLRTGCPKDGCQEGIRMPKSCPVHGALEDHEQPVKLGCSEDGTLIRLDDNDFDSIDLPTSDAFVLDAIPKMQDVEELALFAIKAYYLVPTTKAGLLLYDNIVRSLTKQNKVLLGKFTVRSEREKLGIIRPLGDTLLLQRVPFSAQLRVRPQFDHTENKAKELALVANVLEAIDPAHSYAKICDEYDIALSKLIEKKVKASKTGKPLAATKKARPNVEDNSVMNQLEEIVNRSAKTRKLATR